MTVTQATGTDTTTAPRAPFTRCWTCPQGATHRMTRDSAATIHACDRCTDIWRADALLAGFTIEKMAAAGTNRPAAQARPLTGAIVLALPKPMDHQPKAQRTRHAKPGRFDSAERRRFNLTLIAARVNSGVLTAASYLKQLGADDDTIRRYASQLGKRVKALAAAKGITPTLAGLAVVGRRLVRCLAYSPAEIEILRSATADYTRTAHLIGA